MFARPRTEPLDNRHRLGVSIAVLFALLLIGACGFYLLSVNTPVFDSIYLNTLTTVGMKEGRLNLNTPQQAWVLFVMLAGISAALYAAGNVVAIIHPDGQRSFNPPPDTQLNHNDKMVIISSVGGVDKIMNTLGEKSP